MIKKVAFVFPGQGSQSIGLLNSFGDSSIIHSTFDNASKKLGYDLWKLGQEGPLEQLNQTIYTQPLLLTAGVALWELWKAEGGLIPNYLLGNSLGEFTAYVCGESIEFEKALPLVEKRGLYMQNATASVKNAMAVIVGLTKDQVLALCQQQKEHEIVSPSNYNTETQIVISGHQAAVSRVMQAARTIGATLVKQLPISVPAHCALMEPAIEPLKHALDSIAVQVPKIPVMSNVYSKSLYSATAIQSALVYQLVNPVPWVDNICALLKQGVNCFVECGPNQVLTRLIRQIAPEVMTLSLGRKKDFYKALHQLK